tara:strand:+ start:664 stop:915 length:252 start_codon:yes stop_codon:yes gene_type:complete
MNEKDAFGENTSKDLKIGDIVEWSTWDSDEEEWLCHYGVLVELKNEIRSNRLVSISKVLPINAQDIELEFFTLSLRRVSAAPN